MADFFDIVDIVFAAVDRAGTGLPAYKHRAETGVKVDHIVVNTTGVAVKSYVNKAPVVNVNLFIRPYPNGMINARQIQMQAGKIREAIKHPPAPPGMYFNARVAWEGEIETGDSFTLYNIRVEVITEK